MCRRAEFEIMGPGVALNIQDTGGSYVDDFPVMVELSIQSADAVILGKRNMRYIEVARQSLPFSL